MKLKLTLAMLMAALSAQAQYLMPSNPPPQIKLLWDPSPSVVITNYWVYIGTNSGQFYGKLACNTNTSVTLTNLSRGQTYYFSCTAQNAVGLESSLSSEVSVTLKPLPMPPVMRNPVIITAQMRVIAEPLTEVGWCDIGGIAVEPDQTNAVYRLKIARVK